MRSAGLHGLANGIGVGVAHTALVMGGTNLARDDIERPVRDSRQRPYVPPRAVSIPRSFRASAIFRNLAPRGLPLMRYARMPDGLSSKLFHPLMIRN